ncbi:hypothetical protein ACF1BN_21770 [Streptomyces sp. NPDC014861]
MTTIDDQPPPRRQRAESQAFDALDRLPTGFCRETSSTTSRP